MNANNLERNLEAWSETGDISPSRKPVYEAIHHRMSEIPSSETPPFSAPDGADVVFLGSFGIGLLSPVMTRIGGGKVSLVEPDPKLLTAVLVREDLSGHIREGNLCLYAQSSPDEIARRWQLPQRERALARLVLVDGAGPDAIRRSFFEEVRDKIAARERDSVLDTGAVRALGGLVVENALTNLSLLPSSRPLESLFSIGDVPGIVVSAGPSLDNNAPELGTFEDSAVVISVDTAVKPLAQHGIRPHIVVGVDPRERNVANVAGADLSESLLVNEIGSHPALSRLPARDRALFAADNPIGRALHELGVTLPSMEVFGSVAVAAFELACRMSLNPVVFVGQDLAYSNGKEYCRATTPGASPSTPSDETAWDTDIHGDKVRTTLRLLCFRDWLEQRIARERSRTIINATGGGILKRGVAQMSLAEVGTTLKGRPRGIKARVASVSRDGNTVPRKEIVQAFDRLRREARRGLRILEKGRIRNPRKTLESFTRMKALAGLVDVIEAASLMDLRSTWQSRTSPSRERELFSILIRACRRLISILDRIDEV